MGLEIRGIFSSNFSVARRRPFLIETNLADTLVLFSIINEVISHRTLPWVPGLGGFSYLHTVTRRLATCHAV